MAIRLTERDRCTVPFRHIDSDADYRSARQPALTPKPGIAGRLSAISLRRSGQRRYVNRFCKRSANGRYELPALQLEVL